MFDLNDDLIRNAVAYHQSTLRTGANPRLDGSIAPALRRMIGAFCIRIGERLQDDTAAAPGTSAPARLALP